MKKRFISIILALVMVMSAVTVVVPVRVSAIDSDTLKTAGKALIQKGISKIPYVGSVASTLLGPTLNKLFGISEDNSLEEIEKKLDQIDKKLDDIQADLSDIEQSISQIILHIFSNFWFLLFNFWFSLFKSMFTNRSNRIRNTY